MPFKLAASNLGWRKEDDERVYALLQSLGYQGLELAPTRIFPERPYEQLRAAAVFAGYLHQNYGLAIPSMQSIWYGQNGSIFDPQQAAQLEAYTAEAFAFAGAVRCTNLVFGNPRQRNCPEGRSSAEADDFFTRLGILAGQKGVRLAIEPNPPVYHTNYLNTTPEALALVKRLALPGLTVNLDVGTMIAGGETAEMLRENIRHISHVHISEPGLGVPEHRPLHRELAALLRETDYQGFVSLEMMAQDYETVERTLYYLAEVFV